MCVTPYQSVIYKGAVPVPMEFPCGHCWACYLNRQNDLVGRALCEVPYSSHQWFVTLTYDDRKLYDPLQTQMIFKRDFQNFMKKLRFAGHKLKYLCAGEYGYEKGRTHFHAALLWLGMPPKIGRYWNGKQSLDAWPFGHCDIEQTVNERNMRYVAKYLIKNKKQKQKPKPGLSQEWVTYSKKPLMGHAFILDKAKRQAEMAVMPRTLNYIPPGGDMRNRYSLYGKAQEVYFDELFSVNPDLKTAPRTEWIENAVLRYLKVKARREWEALTTEEQSLISTSEIMDRRLTPVDTELTSQQKLARGYERHDALVRFNKWQKEHEKDQTKEGQRRLLNRSLFNQYGFTLD